MGMMPRLSSRDSSSTPNSAVFWPLLSCMVRNTRSSGLHCTIEPSLPTNGLRPGSRCHPRSPRRLGSGFALGVMEHDILLMLRPFFAMVEAGTVVFDDIEGRTKLFGRRRGRNGGIAPPVGFVKQEIVRRLKLRFVERVLFCRIGRWPGSRTGARGACERQHAQDEDRPRASLAAVTTDREILSLPPRRGWPPHSDVRIR